MSWWNVRQDTFPFKLSRYKAIGLAYLPVQDRTGSSHGCLYLPIAFA